MDDVADLVVTPFRDIVDKGRTAIDIAGDSQPMLKVAQNLVKEGERALRRIEPLCKKHFDEYGPSFVTALRENDEIAEYRTKLTDLLWEFDDYVQVDDFDADKFAELQSLSRAAAPKIYDILMRMKLEFPVQFDSLHFMSQLSPPSSPHPAPTMLFPTLPPPPIPGPAYMSRDSVSSSRTDTRSLGEFQSVEAATELRGSIIDRTESHETASEFAQPSTEIVPPPVPEPVEAPPRPPRPPSANPWDFKVTAVADDGRPGDDISISRRPPVEPAPETPIEKSSSTSLPFVGNFATPQPTTSDGSGRATGSAEDYSYGGEEQRRSLYHQFSGYSLSRPRAPTIPEENTTNRVGEARPHPTLVTYSPMPYRLQHPRHVSLPAALEEGHDTNGGSHRNDSLGDLAPPDTRDRAPSIAESMIDPNPFPVNTRAINDRPVTATPDSQPGLELVGHERGAPIMPTEPIDDGLIPVESTPPPTPLANLPQRYCSIDNNSSFYLHKGFCEGAEEVIRGGIGVKKTKKPGIAGTAVVARCTHCLFELDFKHIEFDVLKQAEGNYAKNGIGYRLRFLQKSHVHTKRVDDVMYGCVFCIHLGRTLDESDATLFTTTSALFSHLACHPRPLPDVPGIAVVDQVEVPAGLRNDYDLHFRNPPGPHPMGEKAAEIANLPTGVARESARKLLGKKLLADRTPALELVQGARITGLTWPWQYNGEWCFGWHDGVYASMPTEILKLDRPPWSQIKRSGITRIQARARWKFAPKDKDKEEWLKFDKDDIITNISWSYPEHWCWAGTNAKGKWGIFPQAFINTNTLQERTPTDSDRASIISNEKRSSSSSILPRFSRRNKSGRPASIAGSTSSGETTRRSGFYRF